MNKQRSNLFKTIKLSAAKHSPEILTGIGIAGMFAATVLAVKSTPKAILLIEERKEELDCEKLTPIEVVKTTWKCYIPATVTGVTSAACLIGASSVNARRNAALATAYNLSKVAMTEYKEKVIETIGERKEQAIKDSIAKDKIEKDPVCTREIIITEKGNTLCYDGIFGRYFKSDIESIKKALNKINREVLYGDMYVSLNDFYSELGLSHVPIGDELGWNIDAGQIDVEFSSQLTEDGTPCLVMYYSVAPRYNFSKLF